MGGEVAEGDVTCFGKRLRIPRIFLQRIKILGLHENARVTCQKPRHIRNLVIVGRHDHEVGDIVPERSGEFKMG